MKKLLLMALAILSMSAAAQEVAVKPFNVRYIDEDRLYQQYVVAQQYLQLQSQLKNDLQQAEKKKRTQIENFYNQVQTKYKNNQYKTQKALEADQKKLETMQENAQKEMEALQKKYEQQLNQEQMKLANEIDLFLTDYAVKNDYDAILLVARDSEILWAAGVGISETAKLRPGSRGLRLEAREYRRDWGGHEDA